MDRASLLGGCYIQFIEKWSKNKKPDAGDCDSGDGDGDGGDGGDGDGGDGDGGDGDGGDGDGGGDDDCNKGVGGMHAVGEICFIM